MESAIPKQLVCPRTQARRIADDFVPLYPAWSARLPNIEAVTVMAYFGIQFRDESQRSIALARLSEVDGLLSLNHGSTYRDYAHYVDQAGFHNFLTIAYWQDDKTYQAWQLNTAVSEWWQDKASHAGGLGFFREVFTPSSDRFEVLYSSPDQKEGVGAALGIRSAEDVQEHSYWGSARDRLAIAQTDLLVQSGALSAAAGSSSKVIRIIGHENLALIRSGQDWTDTKGKERSLYLDGSEPILREAMNFLRDEGQSIGCYVNRYLTCIDVNGKAIEKSFGLSCWRSLGDMEAWAEHHPTHVRIFGNFMQTVQALEGQLDLGLYHEVSVLKAGQQFYEYMNCHEKTGLLGSVHQR
jgi:aldoxime dehydratase